MPRVCYFWYVGGVVCVLVRVEFVFAGRGHHRTANQERKRHEHVFFLLVLVQRCRRWGAKSCLANLFFLDRSAKNSPMFERFRC